MADAGAIVTRVYGEGLPSALRAAATAAVHAYLDYLEETEGA